MTPATYVSIDSYSITFDEWETCIRQIHSKLKVLYVIIRSEDIDFLDAYRWEEFFVQYLPRLEKFSLQYYEYIDGRRVFPMYFLESNQFTSSFWIKRQWLLETEIDGENLIYSIRSYKYI